MTNVRPYDGAVALRLMRALQARGDRAGALEHAARYSERLHRDLEAEPEPAIVALVNELRKAPANTSQHGAIEWRAEGPVRREDAQESIVPVFTAGHGRREDHASPVPRLAWLGALVAAILVLVTMVAGGPNESRSEGSLTSLAVFPFVVVGDSQYSYLGEGMARLLSTGLDGGGQLVTLSAATVIAASSRDPTVGTDLDRTRSIAESLGVARFVTGTVVGQGGHLRLAATLRSVTRTNAGRREITAEGSAAELPHLVDSLTTQLLIADARPTDRLIRIASATTRSIPALKEYLQGDRSFRAGAYDEAARAFARATEIDPTFALATIAAPWRFCGSIFRPLPQMSMTRLRSVTPTAFPRVTASWCSPTPLGVAATRARPRSVTRRSRLVIATTPKPSSSGEKRAFTTPPY